MFHINANAAVLLHFVALMQTHVLAVQVAQNVFFKVSPF
jgi:hypothetical protein